MSQQAVEYIEENKERFLDELKEYLRIPSISTDPTQKDEVARCARWVADHLEEIGIDTVEIEETAGHPIVYAEHCKAPGKPTILIYGHYDVQPPDPLDLWDTPPFEPDVRDGKIFARGATDDKGQLFAHVKGLEAHLQTSGELPVNVKLLIEGEEEVGSPNLTPWVLENKERLACDAVVISDSSMFAPGVPTITYGLRGLTYFEVTVTGPSHDLHSGLFGGTVPNPINELAKIIAQLHDADGRIAVPGFYDDVIALEDDEREQFASLPFDEEGYLAETGAPGLQGEEGYTTLERKWARPTLDCNGIWGGFIGEGAKTVLPSTASAKISCRLVPGQDPAKVLELCQNYIEEIAPDTVKVEFKPHHGGDPVLIDRDNETVRAACRALQKSWDAETVFTRGGGSIPVVATFSNELESPTILMGLGLDDDRLHSPNEKFNLECFYKGIETSAYLWNEL
ncbi:dipeptidase [Persicimonas caeni]|jgi:acetylornithine deacetylase/succinyl-diaminopimelate desuccinylase-like protein|uniref:Dipeptidase n=1 Tax=Persicimonas caeni TaxID=2292766 RepID=A0A4Y6PUF6_PERCE|nr:dipeptidase [Persicimonas caeni]QDG51647.1 dipeptidase [Persicimonas caeni]QED32868.1 dipeptidase [Persicimonas caeni]